MCRYYNCKKVDTYLDDQVSDALVSIHTKQHAIRVNEWLLLRHCWGAIWLKDRRRSRVLHMTTAELNICQEQASIACALTLMQPCFPDCPLRNDLL